LAASADAFALLTNAEMGRADALAVEQGRSGVELMERAGRAVAEAASGRWTPRPVLVLCGPGNNGGDGFVVARQLQRAGWEVRLALLGEISSLRGDAAVQAAAWEGPVEALRPEALEGAELFVDAIFGAGLSRPLEGAAHAVVEALGQTGLPVVAVDVPSGLSGDSGAPLGDAVVEASLTVTFFRKKPGHLLYPGRRLCGEVLVADIGIPVSVLQEIGPSCHENAPPLWLSHYPWRHAEQHKYDFGHALIVGGQRMTGAGRLAGRAALRAGAGLVTIAAPASALPIYALTSPSIILTELAPEAGLAEALADPRRNALLLGPGGGGGAVMRNRVLECLASGRAMVLDADALTAFEEDPAQLLESCHERCVLTPHEGEFRRVFPTLKGDKLSRARQASKASGAVVLLKGADSVVVAPDGRAVINANAVADLATAGSGDVLAGIITALLAQGMPAFEATCAGVWLHSVAAGTFGLGLISEDLVEALPVALAALRKAEELREYNK
jgi:hydroxyethylthiazole kinase-like uncharacterized protein yjeF